MSMKTGSTINRIGSRHGGTAVPTTLASLDIGSTKICCVIAEAMPNKHKSLADVQPALKVLGFGQTASRGIKAGSIINVDEAERAIRLAVDAAERMAERHINAVHVNVSGGKPYSQVTRGQVQSTTGVISPRDADNAVSAAIATVDVGQRQVLHLMPVTFGLDGVESADVPMGLHGASLTTEMGVVTVDPAALRNLSLTVERCHLSISGFAVSPYAAARGVLASDERSLGSIVIDMGGGTTSVAIFKHGKLAAAFVIPIGGMQVTSDVAQGLSTSLAHAERMKTMFGAVWPTGYDDREMLAVPLVGERGVDTVQKVPRSTLSAIIKPRIEEIFDLVIRRLSDNPQLVAAAGRIVLTGGASQLPGLRELAQAMFGRQVRLGQPQPQAGMPEMARSNGFAAAFGLLGLAANPDKLYAMPQAAQAAIDRSQLTYAQRVGRWLAEAI
jgi:cell division protein FtsA